MRRRQGIGDARSGIGTASSHHYRRRVGGANRRRVRLAGLRDRAGCARRDARHRQPADTGRNSPRRASMRVVIADDAPLIREGVTRLLTERRRRSRAGRRRRRAAPHVSATSARTSRSSTRSNAAEHRRRKGYAPPRKSRSAPSGTAVPVLSQHLEPAYALRLIDQQLERAGYLMKERVGRVEELLDALERVAAGGCVVDRAIVEELLARRRQRTTRRAHAARA